MAAAVAVVGRYQGEQEQRTGMGSHSVVVALVTRYHLVSLSLDHSGEVAAAAVTLVAYRYRHRSPAVMTLTLMLMMPTAVVVAMVWTVVVAALVIGLWQR